MQPSDTAPRASIAASFTSHSCMGRGRYQWAWSVGVVSGIPERRGCLSAGAVVLVAEPH